LGKVFAGTDIQNGLQWTITASHELREMLADPDIDLNGFHSARHQTGRIYVYEVCDTCEADHYWYAINCPPQELGRGLKRGKLQPNLKGEEVKSKDVGRHEFRPAWA
jgi:hypothetical protein